LEIGHTLKDKEVVIGTTCDLRIKNNVDIQANLNGICLQANNIFINKHSKLLANKKAPISLIANNSITIRKSNIQTDGEVNISSKVFEPFLNEILISKDTKILAAAINMNTPSNLLINSGAKLKANDIVLNGGNCEVRENDDEDKDNEHYQEKSAKKFKPKFMYGGSCLNNPISTNLKISSVVDSLDHLKLVYTIAGVSSDLTVKWKFDDEIEASENNISQTYAFPGRHLVEAVIKSNDGYFRKFGQYSNVSPTKYNNGQIAIFQFFGIRNMPNKLIGLINNSQFVLYKSENDSRKYIGEINNNIAGEKVLVVPEVGYRVTFKLNVMAEIVDPEQYIDNYIKKIRDSFEYIEAYNLDQSYLDGILIGLKTYITTLTTNEKLILANTIQSNSKSFNSLVTKNNLILNRKYASYFFSLFVPTAYAQDSTVISDKNTHDKMLKMSIAVAAIISGVETVSFGGSLIKNSDKKRVAQFTGYGFILVGLAEIVYGVYSVKDILKYIYSLDYKSIFGKFITELKSLTVSTFEIKSSFVPLSAATAYSDLYNNTLKSKDKLNEIIKEYNSSVADINSALTMLRMPANLISIDPITFPLNTTIGKLSTDFINKDSIKILKSETGDVTLSDITKVDDKISLKVHALKTQNIVIQFLYKNISLGINQLVNLNSRVIVAPKAVINYTKTGLKVSFNSTDPNDPDITGLKYFWDFGDNQTLTTSSKIFSHTYSTAGTYNVSLTVTDSYGLSSTKNESVVVKKNQSQDKILHKIVDTSLIRISGINTSVPISSDATYLWDFGDGTVRTTNSASTSHRYQSTGLYELSVTVEGIEISTTISILVPVLEIVNQPIGTVGYGSSWEYKIKCNIGERVLMDMSVFNFNTAGLVESEDSFTCSGLGEVGVGVNTYESIHTITCTPKVLSCPYSFIMQLNLTFYCAVIENGMTYSSDFKVATPHLVDYVIPGGCSNEN
jgi:PKD repeat protein